MFRIFNITLSLPILTLQRHLNSSLPSKIFHSQCLNSHSCSELEYVVDLVKYEGPFKKAKQLILQRIFQLFPSAGSLLSIPLPISLFALTWCFSSAIQYSSKLFLLGRNKMGMGTGLLTLFNEDTSENLSQVGHCNTIKAWHAQQTTVSSHQSRLKYRYGSLSASSLYTKTGVVRWIIGRGCIKSDTTQRWVGKDRLYTGWYENIWKQQQWMTVESHKKKKKKFVVLHLNAVNMKKS